MTARPVAALPRVVGRQRADHRRTRWAGPPAGPRVSSSFIAASPGAVQAATAVRDQRRATPRRRTAMLERRRRAGHPGEVGVELVDRRRRRARQPSKQPSPRVRPASSARTTGVAASTTPRPRTASTVGLRIRHARHATYDGGDGRPPLARAPVRGLDRRPRQPAALAGHARHRAARAGAGRRAPARPRHPGPDQRDRVRTSTSPPSTARSNCSSSSASCGTPTSATARRPTGRPRTSTATSCATAAARVVDADPRSSTRSSAACATQAGFVLDRSHLTVFGTCRDCEPEQNEADAGR